MIQCFYEKLTIIQTKNDRKIIEFIVLVRNQTEIEIKRKDTWYHMHRSRNTVTLIPHADAILRKSTCQKTSIYFNILWYIRLLRAFQSLACMLFAIFFVSCVLFFYSILFWCVWVYYFFLFISLATLGSLAFFGS